MGSNMRHVKEERFSFFTFKMLGNKLTRFVVHCIGKIKSAVWLNVCVSVVKIGRVKIITRSFENTVKFVESTM